MPTLGRGKLYFDKFTPGTKTLTGERYIGNTPEFNLNSESETLDHFNSDEGVRVKDDSVLLQLDRGGSFITDVISPANMALFLLGNATVLAQASGAAIATNKDGVTQDTYYQLGQSTSNPTGDRDVSVVVVKDDTTPTATTFVVNTDYTVDAVRGRIYIVPGGNIDDGTNLRITHTRAAKSRNRIVTAASATIEGALRFIAANPKGDNIDFYMPYVQLAPNGDFALKGDEWQQLPFNVEILKLDPYESIYADGQPYTP